MPKIAPHGTRRMPRTQTTVDRGHDRGFAQINERQFSAEKRKNTFFFFSVLNFQPTGKLRPSSTHISVQLVTGRKPKKLTLGI